MKNSNELKAMVNTIIQWHESKDFESVSSRIAEKEITAATWFTKKRFDEVCAEIDKQIGTIVSLEYIDTFKRKSSYLTLWKASYSKTSDDVLWQITFDTNSNKIMLMHINWEHN